MSLFNSKTIDRHIGTETSPSEEQGAIIEQWSELIRSGRIKDYKETAFHGEFKSRIIEKLLGYHGPAQSHIHSVSQEQSILKGSVDLALGNFEGSSGQVVAPLELKDANTDPDAIMPGRNKSPVQQAWEYATNAPGVKWVLVSNYLEIRLYGFGEGTQNYERFDLSKLDDPREYARFQLLLNVENLLTGKTEDLLNESRREDKDITNALYADYKQMRNTLIFTISQQLPDLNPLDAIAAAQTVLDRVLFTAFAEDTELLPDNILEKAFDHSDPFNPRPVWETFKSLFEAINLGNEALNVPPYNGGLFAPDPIVDGLNIPDSVCEKFKDIGAYDFASEISVTVLGHIFEQSIADVERLQAQARGEEVAPEKKTGTTGRRKRDGVVYTPDYIARFIVEQTLGTHLREIFAGILADFAQKGASADDYEAIKWKRKGAELEAWEAYRDRLKTLRIVDPACGSGVFLVMAFDYMKAELTRVNDKITDLRAGVADLFDPDSEILTNNLFGVDVNSESVEIAKLSLWVKTARYGKVLDSLDGNLKVGDSLIEDSNYAYLDHGFSWNTAFPEVFAEGGFDIVLGNPPYVRQELLGDMKPYLQKRFEVYHGVADLYCYFFERGLRLLKEGGRLGYISSSTFFKTNSGKPLRSYLPKAATLENVVDFGDLQIFEGVTTYPAILTMKNSVANDNVAVSFWNVEEMPKANFRATYEAKRETYPQNALGDGSWEFENPKLKALRDKIRNGKPTLKEVYGSPLYGIKTGRNEAFVIDRATRDRLVAEDPKSAEILKPVLVGRDLKRWIKETQDLHLIFTRRGVDVDNYPAILNFLESKRSTLEPKPIGFPTSEKWSGRKSGKYAWYELQDTVDYHELFAKPKVVYNRFIDKPQFLFDDTGSLINDAPYFIPDADLFLCGFLNSNIAWWEVTSNVPNLRGGFVQVNAKYIEPLPIPPATDTQKVELAALAEACQSAAEARFKLQEGVRRRLPDLCPPEHDAKLTNRLKNWWELPDFSAFQKEIKKNFKTEIPLKDRNDWEDWLTQDKAEIHRLTAEIEANENKINVLVYELFELTDEEIKLLEANI